MTAPYALMADLHLHPWSAFASTNEEGVNTRLAGLVSEIRRCAKELSEAGGTTILVAGDVFHVRGSVSPIVLNYVRDNISRITEEFGVQFYVIPGNHDLEGKESARLSSAVTALESHDVFVSADVMNVPHCSAYLVPWVESAEDLYVRLEVLGAGLKHPEAIDVIIHAPVDGVIAGLPAHGLTPERLAELPFRRVFSGHYHNHKELIRGRVYSIGALAHHTWSDIGSKAGFCLVYPDKVVWRKSHLPEFIDIDRLAGIDDIDDIALIVDGNYIRVRVEASKTKEVEEARAELIAMGAKAVIVQAQPSAPERSASVAVTSTKGASLEESVGAFVKALATPNEAAVMAAALDVLAASIEV